MVNSINNQKNMPPVITNQEVVQVKDYDAALSAIATQAAANSVNAHIAGGFASVLANEGTIQAEICWNGRDVIQAVHENGTHIGQTGASVTAAVADAKTSITAQNFTTLQSLNDAVRDVILKGNQSDLMNLNSFNTSNLAMMGGFNNTNDRQQNATNLIISQGRDLAAQIAECCCENKMLNLELKAAMFEKFCDVKELIRQDGSETRALVNDIRRHELETALADAKLEIALKVK